MRILITGASGMLGSDLSNKLSEAHDVVGVGLQSAPQVHVPFCVCDLALSSPLEDLMNDVQPDIVFHAAAMTNVDGCESEQDMARRHNVDVTRNLVKACNIFNAKLVFFSTDYVFDGEKKGEYLETDEVNPLNEYGRSKVAAEACVVHEANHYIILRTSWLYGIYGRSFPRTILEKAATQSKFSVVADQFGRPTYTRDMAEFLFRAIESGDMNSVDREIIHFAGSTSASWADFARGILKTGGFTESEVESITSDKIDRPARRPKNSVLNVDKMEKVFHGKMPAWEDAIVKFVDEFRNQTEIAES